MSVRSMVALTLCCSTLACGVPLSSVLFKPAWEWESETRELPTTPMLRIEAGRHTAAIRRLATDTSERWLVTGSRDKTARVWDLKTGELLHVLRPPIDELDEGNISAVAMSPDGSTIAMGGVLGWAKRRATSLYLFDRTSGGMIRRIPDLPGMPLDVRFSSDGTRIAVALNGNGGLRVFRAADGELLKKDTDWSAELSAVDFDRSGRLLAVSRDGHVRLYDAQLNVAVERELKDFPALGARFSPDGARVAVGGGREAKMVLLSGSDLRTLGTPAAEGLVGRFHSVGWSPDGESLFAVSHVKERRYYVRRWDGQGLGSFLDLSRSDSLLIDLVTVSGGFIVGNELGDWTRLSTHGTEELGSAASAFDFDPSLFNFAVSHDGKQVQFRTRDGGYSFSIAERVLRPASVEESPSRVARVRVRNELTEKLGPSGWKTNRPIVPPDSITATDENADGMWAAVGSRSSLRTVYDHAQVQGDAGWVRPVPAPVSAVAFAGNMKVVVAATADGLLRWHRFRDGEVLLTAYLHPDGQRWVMWTPSGYYDASPGAEALIGWHTNRGEDAAGDFVAAASLKAKFHQPAVVQKVLETFDEAEAVAIIERR